MAPFASTIHRLRAVAPVNLLALVRHRMAVVRSRRALGQLDDRLLCDIGLTRNQAETEVRRSPWDVPPHWRG